MSDAYTIHPIARIHTDFSDKFGIPRQSGLVPELTARIVLRAGIPGPPTPWWGWTATATCG